MKIDLNLYPFEYGKAVSNPTALENGRSFTLNNESEFIVKKWSIDKVVFKNRVDERCDFLLLVEMRKAVVYFWIELKGSDAMKACQQILSAVSLIGIKENSIQEARIITTKTPAPAFRNNNYARLDKYVRSTGGQLKIYTNKGSEKI